MPKRAKEMSARQVASIKNDGRYAVGGVAGLRLAVEIYQAPFAARFEDISKDGQIT